jgi:ankyrin repeat protein
MELTDEEGNSLLHISVVDEYIELVSYLIVKGINVNIQNNEGDTPLHLCMRIGNKEV